LNRRVRLVLCAGLVALLSLSCAVRSPLKRASGVRSGASYGLYRANLVQTDGSSRRFRLLLFALRPDRIHAEILGPTGTPLFLLDAGGGRAALAFPRDRSAYVGSADPAILESLIGLRLDIEVLVEALLGGDSPESGLVVERVGSVAAGLPERLTIQTAEGRLDLELRKLRTVQGAIDELGRGTAPAGLDVYPLEEWIGRDSAWILSEPPDAEVP